MCVFACVCSSGSVASEMVALLGEYLRSDVTLDLESLKKGGSGLHFLQRILCTACQKLHRYHSFYGAVSSNTVIIDMNVIETGLSVISLKGSFSEEG